jgi:PAS domain S-box-containing protein
MTSENLPNRQADNVRRRAVERVAEHMLTAVSRSGSDMRRMLQELERYTIDLELQVEELQQEKVELELSYDELYDSAPVGYFTIGRHGGIEDSNLTGAGMLGQQRAWLPGQQFAGFLSPESLPAFNEFFRRVMGGYDKESCMATLMKGGNTPVSVYIEAIGVGPESSCRAVVVDVTAVEQARLALREREAQLNLALTASSIGVWEWEINSPDVYWSPECVKIFGIDRLCPTLETVAQRLHPEDAPRVKAIVGQALAEGKEHMVECRVIRPDSEVIWILVRGQVHLNRDGEPLRMIGIVQDITERKRAERDARAAVTNKARPSANFIVASPSTLRS